MSISPQKIQAIACLLSPFITEAAWCVFPLLCSFRRCVQLLLAWCPKVGGYSVQGLLSTCSRTFPRSPFILQALSCYWISSYSSISICLFPATVPRLPVASAAVQFSWSLFFWERFVLLTSCPIPPPSYSSLGPAPFSLPNSSCKHRPSLVTSLHSYLGDCWLRLTTLDITTSFCAETEPRKSIITATVASTFLQWKAQPRTRAVMQPLCTEKKECWKVFRNMPYSPDCFLIILKLLNLCLKFKLKIKGSLVWNLLVKK